MGALLSIVAIAGGWYLALATGVELISRWAPVPRKPLWNVILLVTVVVGFLCTLTLRLAS
jgi:hypothetical protein